MSNNVANKANVANQAIGAELTYEEALKAFKAEWADKRKKEAQEKKQAERNEEREKDVELCKKALAELEGISAHNRRELEAVVLRLNMFIKGERYTRKVKEDK